MEDDSEEVSMIDLELKKPSSMLGTTMSPTLIASMTSQGSCLLLNVRTLWTELVPGSAMMTTCSGRSGSWGGMDSGLGFHDGFLMIGIETLAY